APTDDLAQCANTPGGISPRIRVEACTRILGSGSLSAETRAATLLNRAWSLSLQDRMAEARADYESALDLTPNSHVAHNEMGLFLLRTGDYDNAIAQYDTALRLRPGAAYSLYGRGVAYLREGKTDKGQADLAEARLADSHVDEVFQSIGVRP
ncbi:MAG: tetratricopeptide repeat protein, partial [Alphaproteobacteria bacterium]|nr:tetratricopeptide repeat protein [Alphaproteobacteria bacterium]